ncbi:amino acid-binding protein [Microbacterium lushaniae]|uniref:Amino acid-binding protein n=1 Tax=Microbacterium lushaniae TaxID=2614639 RepID=A0A5J6L0B5_9MICO|nr:amino acid-binding protein [Microbacterium lushaniae]QEW01928.1 amino acid-binding protein [Microbacterium lushaniae]
MNDLAIAVTDVATEVARIGAVLGAAGIGLEGGGVWAGEAHYLVADGAEAVAALEAAGVRGARATPALVTPLRADVPGELGRIMSALAAAGVVVGAQYSDHDNRKVLVVDDIERAREVLG